MSSYLFNYRLAYLASLWVVIPLLSNVAKVSDNIIGIIACLTTATGELLNPRNIIKSINHTHTLSQVSCCQH